MLRSHRFTRLVTADTVQRLKLASTNAQPIARGDSNRGAVASIQDALAALNIAYLVPAEVDGYFGPRTARGVELFQRDYGLVADGIVGRQVMDALDNMFSGDLQRPPIGASIHVGVDQLSVAHYGGGIPELASCKNDARAMEAIASSIGYATTSLLDEQATTSNFLAAVRAAGSQLFHGDTLFVSFSGHGSQIPNSSGDFEADSLDETLCFYDRMLIDDELSGALAELREGVRVHLVFDSCHSGTAAKRLIISRDDQLKASVKDLTARLKTASPYAAQPAFVGFHDDPMADAVWTVTPIRRDKLVEAVDGDRPEVAAFASAQDRRMGEMAKVLSEVLAAGVFGADKAFDGGMQTYNENRDLYDALRSAVGHKEAEHVVCSIVSLSACDDSQTTPAGVPLSLFTYNLTRIWGSNSFTGSYSQFLAGLKRWAREDATPQLDPYGTGGAAFRAGERPFMF